MSIVLMVKHRQAQKAQASARICREPVKLRDSEQLAIKPSVADMPRKGKPGKRERKAFREAGYISDPKLTANQAYDRIYSPAVQTAEHASIRWHKVRVENMPLPQDAVSAYRKAARQAGKHAITFGPKIKL